MATLGIVVVRNHGDGKIHFTQHVETFEPVRLLACFVNFVDRDGDAAEGEGGG